MRDKILNYFFNNQFIECLNFCESNLKDNTKTCLEFAALCSLKLGYYPKALQYCEEIYKTNQSSFWMLTLAKCFVFNHKFDEAFALFNLLLDRKDSLYDESALELAFTYKLVKNFSKADEIFTQLTQKNPYNLELLCHHAELFFKPNPVKSLELHEKIYQLANEIIQKLEKEEYKQENQVYNLQTRLESKENIKNPQIEHLKNYLHTKILPQIAFLYLKLYRTQDSLELFSQLQDYNQQSASFWQNFAKALEFSCNYQGAYDAYQKAMSVHPHATYAFDCAYLLMRVGNFEEGIKMYESRLFYAHEQTFSPKHYSQSLEAYNKLGINAFKDKIICVFCEQGFGDTIMYARCLEKLCKIAKKVLFAPQSALYKMFAQSLKALQNKGKFENMTILKDIPNKFDFAMPICSLPVFCDIKMEDLSTLHTPIFIKEKSKINKIKKIGLFWFTPNATDSDLARNCELQFLIDSLKDTNYELVSFQIEGEEVKNLPSYIENRGIKLKNWQDTYEALEDIDCMISIDSAIAHLSLALEIPTIVLLSDRFDWRWGRYENPQSYFWEKADLLIFKDRENTKKELLEKINKILK